MNNKIFCQDFFIENINDIISLDYKKYKIKSYYIRGGLSNILYKCSLKDSYPVSKKEPRHILLRLYGEIIFENTDTVLNDSVTFTLLAERNLGPKLYGVFNKGRLEEFVPVSFLYLFLCVSLQSFCITIF